MSPGFHSSAGIRRGRTARGMGLAALLWPGPGGIALALALLAFSAPFFRSGPGVPTAGDARAWAALWGALGAVALGCLVGVIANAVWLGVTWRSGRRPRPGEWIRVALSALLAAGFGWVWLGP